MNISVSEYLQSYSSSIGKTRKADSQQFLIYSINRHKIFSNSEFVGGLADRLKGIASALYLAAATNRRFVIDWDGEISLSHNFSPARYDWLYSNARKFINMNTAVKHIDLIDRSEIIDALSPTEIEKELFNNEPIVFLNINSLRLGSFIKYFEDQVGAKVNASTLFAEAFKLLFLFSEKPAFDASRLKIAKMREQGDMFVGVHLRTGAGNGWKDPGLDDWQNYEKVLEFAFAHAEQHGAEKPTFYFLSDSLEARKAVAGRDWKFPVHCDLFEPKHLDRSEDSDMFGNDLTFHEFQMLSMADRLVSGPGGFAALAAQTGGKPFVRYN